MFDVHRAPLSKRSDRLMTNGEYLLNSWSSDLVTITKATLEPKTVTCFTKATLEPKTLKL